MLTIIISMITIIMITPTMRMSRPTIILSMRTRMMNTPTTIMIRLAIIM